MKTLILLIALVAAPLMAGDTQDDLAFDDAPLTEQLEFPAWFKLSFLDLREDLAAAGKAGKRGLIIYFGQKECAYCKAMLERNWGRPDIREFTETRFNVIGVDIKGSRRVTDFDGRDWSERQYAIERKTNFTPSLLFYDVDGTLALKLSGYHRPYEFRAALEYVADRHYRRESFRDFLSRAEQAFSFGEAEMNENPIFSAPPYALDRSWYPADRPLVVFFEQVRCHACDVLHGGPLSDAGIASKFARLDAVQLNMWSDTPVITPSGRKTTARDWAAELGLYYTPTLVFFDEQGIEILRIDSVIWIYRLNNVLDYVISGDFRRYDNFQRWRQQHKR
ncbi:MAG: thioredoxin fold domain-containing protein [Gammaproteobacteria bacterium]|nr:thioredoxin fold domain-containing protein [Gammaproteobacteria bacterium]